MAGISILVFLLCLQGAFGVTYQGYKVYELVPHTNEEVQIIHSLHNDPKYDFWEESRILGKPTNIMVAPQDQRIFEQQLSQKKINYKISIENVERLIQQERIERIMTRSIGLGHISFSSYLTYTEHMAYLRKLAAQYPDITKLEKVGKSYEGRDILTLTISSGPSPTATPKPVIFIDAGIHCREWIAPPVALYVIHQLVENSINAALYENVDWVILPNLNPDGYEYTQSTDRLWRKNRRLTTGALCTGTDLNRNYGHYWMYDGASDNPCMDTFAGPEPFSEPETQAVRDWFLANGQNVKLYLTVHSFGEYMLYPWGYAPILPEDAEELQFVGDLFGDAIKKASTINSSYWVVNSAVGLYPAAGGADDWVKAVGGVALSYTVELPNGDAPFAFMLPARQILPVVQETFEGVKAMHKYIEEKFWTNAHRNINQFLRDV